MGVLTLVISVGFREMKDMARIASLTSTIASHVAEWEQPYVDLAIYETDDPTVIARAIEDFCLRHLGVGVRGALFYRSSIGAVAGLCLHDDRRVALKAYQPNVARTTLEEERAQARRSAGT